MNYIARVRFSILFGCFVFLVGCSNIPKVPDFSKPVKITNLSEGAWVVDIGKALDRPSRYNLSRLEAAKEAQRRECEYFQTDSLLNEQLNPFKGQLAYRCATEDSESVFTTREIFRLQSL